MFPLRDDQPVFSTPFVTYFLIAINLLIYFFEWQIGLQSRGQLNGLITQFGVVPRLEIGLLTGTPVFSPVAALLPIFTSMFLHGSLLHVLGNMWMLWIFGDNIEDYLGHFAYLVFYLLSGVAASLTHIMFNASSRMPSIGASGAIAGVMGAYFILYPQGARADLVPSDLRLPDSSVADAGLLGREPVPQRRGHGDRRDLADHRRYCLLGTRWRVRGGNSSHQVVSSEAGAVSVWNLVSIVT